MKGWISLQKQVRKNWVWDDPKYFRAWVDMLMMANYSEVKKPYKDSIVLIKRGEFPVSYRKLGERWGMAKNTVIRFINRLKADTMIDTHTDYGFTLVKIVNYDKYQSQADTGVDTVSDTPSDTVSDTVGGTTIIKDNNINKRNKLAKIKILDRKKIFAKECHDAGILKGDDLEGFIDYWSEHNPLGKKMKFEMEKTWSTNGRMRTWERRSRVINKTELVKTPHVEIKKSWVGYCVECHDKKEFPNGEPTGAGDKICQKCGDHYYQTKNMYRHELSQRNPQLTKKKNLKPKKTHLSNEEIFKKIGFNMKSVA